MEYCKVRKEDRSLLHSRPRRMNARSSLGSEEEDLQWSFLRLVLPDCNDWRWLSRETNDSNVLFPQSILQLLRSSSHSPSLYFVPWTRVFLKLLLRNKKSRVIFGPLLGTLRWFILSCSNTHPRAWCKAIFARSSFQYYWTCRNRITSIETRETLPFSPCSYHERAAVRDYASQEYTPVLMQWLVDRQHLGMVQSNTNDWDRWYDIPMDMHLLTS